MAKRLKQRPQTEHSWMGTDLSPLLQRIYQARGISCQNQLSRSLKDLLPVNTLLGIEQAAMILADQVMTQKRLLIIGDFDADGATSTAVAVRSLRALGAKFVDYLVPNRFEYGYGLTPEIVAVAATRQPDVIITVDNGIASIDGVAAAKALGIKVVITDHHLPGTQLPDADAMVNPNQPHDTFLSKHLAGVGVIFYVMLALRAQLRQCVWFNEARKEPNLAEYLDLVALGTVADVVILDDNNRILVHQGLQRIRANECCAGIKAIIEIAGRQCTTLVASDLGFLIGPRLNAAGRLDDMSLGIECLLSDDPQLARDMAKELDVLNQERKQIEQDMQQQALSALSWFEGHFDVDALPFGLSLFHEDWHQGVMGIVAARIKEKTARPVICFSRVNETELKGSARSITGLHIRDVLETIATRHPGMILKFGGHAMAAGLTIDSTQWEAFTAAFDTVVREHITHDDLQETIWYDDVLTAHELSLETAHLLRQAGPWGQGFPEPIFMGRFRVVEQRLLAGKHLRFTLETQGKTTQAIQFNSDPEQAASAMKWIDIAYRLDLNYFRDNVTVQLQIVHISHPMDIVASAT